MADYLSVKEVAEACGVSLRTVRRWLANRELEGAFQDPEGEKKWHIPPLSILDRLPSGSDTDEADPKKRGTLKHQLSEARHSLELEVNRRIAAEKLVEAHKERIDEQVKAITFYQAAIEAPKFEAPVTKYKKRTPKSVVEMLDNEPDTTDPNIEPNDYDKVEQVERAVADSKKKKRWWR